MVLVYAGNVMVLVLCIAQGAIMKAVASVGNVMALAILGTPISVFLGADCC